MPMVGGGDMTQAPGFSLFLCQGLPSGNVITYFMKVHILLSVHPYLTLRYLGRGTTVEEYA